MPHKKPPAYPLGSGLNSSENLLNSLAHTEQCAAGAEVFGELFISWSYRLAGEGMDTQARAARSANDCIADFQRQSFVSLLILSRCAKLAITLGS